MKTMTCKQMGGPCDHEITASSAEEMMKMGGDHVMEMKDKDAGHKAAAEMMEASLKDPAALKAWQDKFMSDYEATPEA